MNQQLLKTANRKQQNTDNVLLLVENCDIKLEILNKSTHLNQPQTQIAVMSDLFFCEGFSLVHVNITAIISLTLQHKVSRQANISNIRWPFHSFEGSPAKWCHSRTCNAMHQKNINHWKEDYKIKIWGFPFHHYPLIHLEIFYSLYLVDMRKTSKIA